MRVGRTPPVLCVLAALAACQAPRGRLEPIPPAAPAPEAPAATLPEEEPPQGESAAAMAVLRTHLLQLLPCDTGAAGQVEVLVSLAPGGRVQSMRVGDGNVAPETARCVLSRMAWWRFPDSAQGRLSFDVEFPLQPPSINDHTAVVVAGGGQIDLAAATAELRRLRKRVVGCYRGRLTAASEPLLVLLWIRLGEWGRLSDVGLEVDSGAKTRFHRAQETGCLKRALRLAAFPNPSGGDVELRFPYVLTR